MGQVAEDLEGVLLTHLYMRVCPSDRSYFRRSVAHIVLSLKMSKNGQNSMENSPHCIEMFRNYLLGLDISNKYVCLLVRPQWVHF